MAQDARLWIAGVGAIAVSAFSLLGREAQWEWLILLGCGAALLVWAAANLRRAVGGGRD